jgi:enoyl-CoA hydratase
MSQQAGSVCTEDELLIRTGGGVLVLMINRYERRNAINYNVSIRLNDALLAFDADPSQAVAVLSGAGGVFSAGMDLADFAAGRSPVVEGRGLGGLTRVPPAKPVVAAVEGFALAGGFEMVLACDVIVAARGAMFGLPEVKRGLVAAAGGLTRLATRTSHYAAMEVLLTGDPIPAERAYELGLVSRLVDPGQALAEAVTVATRIAANAPMAVAACKRIVTMADQWPSAERYDRARAEAMPILESEDAKEGALAFVQKRPPQWRGV